TVGPILARRLGWTFVDLDLEIEAQAGRRVAEIFEAGGEPAFREAALAAAPRAASLSRVGLAAGGGAFTVPLTRATLQAGALTVWLRCDLDTLLGRIPADGSRP